MICKECRQAADWLEGTPHGKTAAQALHARCKGRTHCDCQHKVELQGTYRKEDRA